MAASRAHSYASCGTMSRSSDPPSSTAVERELPPGDRDPGSELDSDLVMMGVGEREGGPPIR